MSDTGAGTPLNKPWAKKRANPVANPLDDVLSATDPAGLDVALREVEDAAIDARPAWAAGARWAAKRIADATAARLSVADGPGPEERPSVEALAIALHSDGEDCPAEITWDRPCPGPSQHMERAARLRAALPVEETGR